MKPKKCVKPEGYVSPKAAMNTCLATSALVANASAIIAPIAPTANPTLFVGIMCRYDIL